MNFVFNELCVSSLEEFSQADFNQWLNTWLDLLAYSRHLFKDEPCLYSEDSKMGLLPYPYMNQWLQTIPIDRRRLFLALRDRHPYLTREREPLAYDDYLLSDYSYEGELAKGLGIAYLLDGIAFSFPSDVKWDTSHLNIHVYKLNKDVCAKVFEAKVRHAIRNEHLDLHKQYMGSLEACKEKIPNLLLLQSYWEDVFPHLEKSNTVFDEMEKTPLNRHSFLKIVENLFKLNQFLDNGETNIMKFGNYSDESDTTKHKFGKKREFLFDTETKRCYRHLKLWEINWRIHFDIDYEKRVAYIGYIGEHLPI